MIEDSGGPSIHHDVDDDDDNVPKNADNGNNNKKKKKNIPVAVATACVVLFMLAALFLGVVVVAGTSTKSNKSNASASANSASRNADKSIDVAETTRIDTTRILDTISASSSLTRPSASSKTSTRTMMTTSTSTIRQTTTTTTTTTATAATTATTATTATDAPTSLANVPKQPNQEARPLLWKTENINGILQYEHFGTSLAYSADGNVVVAAAALIEDLGWTTIMSGQVRAYRYQAELDEWQPLGQFIDAIATSNTNTTRDEIIYGNEISLSPNGKFLAIASFPRSGVNFVRVFALVNKNNDTDIDISKQAAASNDAVVVMWQQVGTDITSPSPPNSTNVFGHALSLMDNLVLAVSDLGYQGVPGRGKNIYILTFDSALDMWIRMGQQDIQHNGYSLRLIQQRDQQDISHSGTNNNSTTSMMLLLAVGGLKRARTYRYDPDANAWMQYGSDLLLDDVERETAFNLNAGVFVDFSMDGTILALGLLRYGGGYGGDRRVRVFSYNYANNTGGGAAAADWVPLSSDIQDNDDNDDNNNNISSFFAFGHFALSANGKVLATTTYELNVTNDDDIYTMPNGQIRIWDFISKDEEIGGSDSINNNGSSIVVGNNGNGNGNTGDWIQRSGPPLELGLPGSLFGWKVALSQDGNRLAVSATMGMNNQGIASGKVRVFELLLNTTNASSSSSS